MSLDNTLLTLTLATVLNSPLDLATASVPLAYSKSIGLSSGTGANQADKIFHDQRTIAPSGTDDLDLAGVLVDALGVAITFARIKGIILYAATANTNSCVLGGAASNQFVNWISAATSTVPIGPNGLFCLIRPDATAYAVTAGTGDLLRVTNGGAGTSVTYDIILIGSSA